MRITVETPHQFEADQALAIKEIILIRTCWLNFNNVVEIE